ncbi:MAG: tRNA ((7)-)-methyltransferase [Pelosinus sp.]|jgi:tRNA (guanine-N7-)-methyltransferase|nr:tRNA ((7)-)-methyltransferase [Pelosinus sp.]
MRLRRKPWVDAALENYSDIVVIKEIPFGVPSQIRMDSDQEKTNVHEHRKGHWHEVFGRKAPLYVELGTGKGSFISQLAEENPEVNFIGIEAQQDVLFYAAQKVREKGLTNVRLLVFDINNVLDIFAPGEVDRLYINFCDPWPKVRHAKRRLTHANFLDKYRILLSVGGEIFFKTDNRPLFDFSLEQFAACNLEVNEVTFDLHKSDYQGNVMTEYEKKFSSMGTPINRCEVKFS